MKAIQQINAVQELIKQCKSELTTAISLSEDAKNKVIIQKAISAFEAIYQNLETYQD